MKKIIFIILCLISVNVFGKLNEPYVSVKIEQNDKYGASIFGISHQPYFNYDKKKTFYLSFKSFMIKKVYLKLDDESIITLSNPKKVTEKDYYISRTGYYEIPENVKSTKISQHFIFDNNTLEALKSHKIVKIRIEENVLNQKTFLKDYNIEIDFNYIISILDTQYDKKTAIIKKQKEMNNKDNIEGF